MLIIARAVLLPYEEGNEPATPAPAFSPDDEEGLYFSQVAEKLMASDGARRTRFLEGSTAGKLFADFAHRPFPEAAADVETLIAEGLRTQGALPDGCDLALFTFEKDGDPHVCLCRLMWKSVLMHRDDTDEEGAVISRLGRSRRGMPAPGGRECAGMVVNLSTGDVILRDVNVNTFVEEDDDHPSGSRPLFGGVLFPLEETHTEKEAVKAVKAIIREAAPAEAAVPELEPAIARAVSKAVEETGEIRVEEVAREVFREAPQREALVQQVAERAAEEAIEPVIPVENKKVARSLQRLKLRTDTGIAITLPQEMTEDKNLFSVINNPDGTISIFLGNISELRTE